MSFPVYTLRVVRPAALPPYSRGRVRGASRLRRRSARLRDPERPRRRAVCGVPVPVFRIVLRKDRTIRVPRVRVDNPNVAAEVAHALIGDSPYEKLLAILVNALGDIVGAIVIGTTSSISSAAASVRGVFSGAIAHNASGIILAHNHPSGAATPSPEDLRFAENAASASEVLGIPILDNLIVTRDPSVWRSFGCA